MLFSLTYGTEGAKQPMMAHAQRGDPHHRAMVTADWHHTGAVHADSTRVDLLRMHCLSVTRFSALGSLMGLKAGRTYLASRTSFENAAEIG